MICKICDQPTEKIFEKLVLQKYNVGYHQCTSCSFVQTDEPFWLQEAYQSAITSFDIGLIARNNYLSREIPPIIDACFPESDKMIDFAGGYGIFVRLMRDQGYPFFRQDDYCDNLFAKHFDVADAGTKKFDLVTGFEVLEHFSNPLQEIERAFHYSDHAIFSTDLIPKDQSIEDWIYIAKETGQHIAFYSEKTMQLIAEKFNKNYYNKNGHLHIFTTKVFTEEQISYGINNIFIQRNIFGIKKLIKKFRNNRTQLQNHDYHIIKKILNS